MQRCTDIEDLTRKIYDTMSAGDLDMMHELISSEDGVTWIGSDPAEWWTSHDAVIKVFAAQFEAMGGMQIVGADPRGYGAGEVGWMADQPSVRLPDGTQVPMRITAVAQRERDSWRFVQCHASIGIGNDMVVGRELPVS